MLYIAFVILIFLGGYFAYAYFSLRYALKEMEKELREIQEDLGKNQILHLPLPIKALEPIACTINNALGKIRRERQLYSKREREFQKQIENISHDLRTPLTVICGYLSLLKKADGSMGQDKELSETLEILSGKADSMKKLVTQFYDFSRLNAGDFEIQRKSIELNRILRETLMGNYGVLQQASLEVKADIPALPLNVLGEETALERIFSNLLENAGRYAESFLDILVREEKEGISVLFINDTTLLTEQDIPNIFQRFYIGDGSRSRGGTGLGLTVAKALAEKLGGRLEAGAWEQENKQEGARCVYFKLWLPKGTLL